MRCALHGGETRFFGIGFLHIHVRFSKNSRTVVALLQYDATNADAGIDVVERSTNAVFVKFNRRYWGAYSFTKYIILEFPTVSSNESMAFLSPPMFCLLLVPFFSIKEDGNWILLFPLTTCTVFVVVFLANK